MTTTTKQKPARPRQLKDICIPHSLQEAPLRFRLLHQTIT